MKPSGSLASLMPASPCCAPPEVFARDPGIEASPRLPRAVTVRAGKPRPGTLRLWSIQPLAVWEQLQHRRTLYVELDQVDLDSYLFDFLSQYDWMREQMARRLRSYTGHYPWWAHLRPKPDLRRLICEVGPWGARYVRLELAIEPERALLSSIDAWWGRACTDLYLETHETEYAAWDAELKRHGLWSLTSLPEPWNTRRADSWERIFDLDGLARSGLFEDEIQATFERLDLADVVAVTVFAARGRSECARPSLH